MNLAHTMYKARVQMNEWALQSTEQQEIVALNAKSTQLEQANKSKCKTKEENKSKGKEKDNKTSDHNWMKKILQEKRTLKTAILTRSLVRRNIIGACIIIMSKDNGCDIIQMNVATTLTNKKVKKRMTRPIWPHFLIWNTVNTKKNDGYGRVA